VADRVHDANWSLAMVLAWMTYRTEQAVANIKYGRWTPTKLAIGDLLTALRSGSLVAHGRFEGEQIPHPLETVIWSTFEIVVRRIKFAKMFLPSTGTPIAPARRISSPQTQLLDVTLPAAKVRTLWPATRLNAAAETHCQAYLVTEMNRSPGRAPKSKAQLLKECQARFSGLSERGFERAWGYGIKQTGAVGWGKAGRPRKSKTVKG
jgi:hypothetical protein